MPSFPSSSCAISLLEGMCILCSEGSGGSDGGQLWKFLRQWREKGPPPEINISSVPEAYAVEAVEMASITINASELWTGESRID